MKRIAELVILFAFMLAGNLSAQNGVPPGAYAPGAPSGIAPSTPGIPSANGNVFYATNYGVKGGLIHYCDAAWANASHTVTINNTTSYADTQFTSAMNGWIVYGTNSGCPTGQIAGVGATQVPLGVLSGITVPSNSATISNATTGACTSIAGNAICQLVIAPQDDVAALQTAWNATVNACGSLVLPASYMYVSAIIQGPASAQCGIRNNANWTLLHGASVIGQGYNVTAIFPGPAVDVTNCTSGNGGCWFTVPAVSATDNNKYFYGFQINGAGQGTVVNNSATKIGILGNSDAVFDSIAVNQWGIGIGIQLQGSGGAETRCHFCFEFGTGTAEAMSMTQATSCDECILYGSPVDLVVTGNLGNGKAVTRHSSFGVSNGTAEVVVNAGGYWESDNDYGGGNGSNGKDVVQCNGDCVINGSTFPVVNAQNINVVHVTSGGLAKLGNMVGTANLASTGVGLKVDSGGTARDNCGNDFSGSFTPYSIAGVFFPCLTAVYDTSMKTPNVTGTGACLTIGTQTGQPFQGSFICTGATAASTITITPGPTATSGWTCGASDETTVADKPNQTSTTQTTAVLTTAATVQNDVITFSCLPY